jgi:hypothetical protein
MKQLFSTLLVIGMIAFSSGCSGPEPTPEIDVVSVHDGLVNYTPMQTADEFFIPNSIPYQGGYFKVENSDQSSFATKVDILEPDFWQVNEGARQKRKSLKTILTHSDKEIPVHIRIQALN